MPYCPACGNAIEPSFEFCGFCGRALPEAARAPVEREISNAAPATLQYRLSPRRIVVMTVLTFGFYWYYWFYLTWNQYRDHTRNEAFPVWHAMSLGVPIYQLFRTHAHMRAFKGLMVDAGLESTINPGWAVAVVLISSVLGLVSSFLTGGLDTLILLFFTGGPETREVTFRAALLAFGLNLVSLVIVTKLILHIQENLNQYWESLQTMTLTDPKIESGEILVGVIGALAWLTTLVIFVSA